jgi:hypothetical protein
MESTSQSATFEALEDRGLGFLINHIILPPQLPDGENEDDRSSNERRLLQLVMEEATKFSNQCLPGVRSPWKKVTKMLSTWLHVTSGCNLSGPHLIEVLRTMKVGGKNTV